LFRHKWFEQNIIERVMEQSRMHSLLCNRSKINGHTNLVNGHSKMLII